MIKNDKKKAFNANPSVSLDHSISEFEIFKSRVADAVLDFMEAHSDSDLIDCLEKSSLFLTNISGQMEKVFDNQKKTITDQNDLFEIGDDLFPTSKQAGSNSIH